MNNLKKIFICLLFISVVFSLVACSSKEENQETNNGNETANNIIVEETDYYRSIMVADYKRELLISKEEQLTLLMPMKVSPSMMVTMLR